MALGGDVMESMHGSNGRHDQNCNGAESRACMRHAAEALYLATEHDTRLRPAPHQC